MWLKNKILFCIFLFTLSTIPACAGLFGISFSDKEEFVRARETYNAGNYQQAVTELTEYIYKTKNIRRREARAYRLLGLSYEHLGQPEKALETYLEALEFHQKDIPLLLAAAELYQRTELTDQSIALFDRVLQLEPNNLQALSGQAENYIDMGFYSRALQFYDEFFRLNPQAPSINRARYAYAFLRQRNDEKAFINITMAKAEEPENEDYWLLSARAYKGLGHWEDAMADLDIAIMLDPEPTDLYAIKTMWLYQQGKFAPALQLTQQLLKQNPENELALFMIYLNQHKLGNERAARKALEQIKELNKDSFAHRVAEKLLREK